MASRFETPQVLVLGAGGILGEAWMTGVLAGLEERAGFDPRACEGYVGTSAGAIVAAALAARISPRSRLGQLPTQPSVRARDAADGRPALEQAMRFGGAVAAGTLGAAAAPLAALALRSTEAGGAIVRRAALNRLPRGRRSLGRLHRAIEGMNARFDGRLRIAAVDLETGRRVLFGEPGAPEASVVEAVTASCAIPAVFEPGIVGGRSYVDGGAWSPTNLDAAPARRGTRVLCLMPTGAIRPGLAAPLAAFAALTRSLVALETLSLERRGASVTTVWPDAGSGSAMGPNLLDPRPREEVTEAGYSQGCRLASDTLASAA